MKLTDEKQKPSFEGHLRVERVYDNGDVKVEFDEQNLVVNEASNILRDLMFGDAQQITKIHFGDMSLTPTSDLKNVASPQLTDTALINKLYEKATSKEKAIYGGHPAIKYIAVLEKSEFNGDGEQLITEFSLATGTNRIFTRKTRAAIYKDNESSLRFIWWLVFN